jgi:hypothetical protein
VSDGGDANGTTNLELGHVDHVLKYTSLPSSPVHCKQKCASDLFCSRE